MSSRAAVIAGKMLPSPAARAMPATTFSHSVDPTMNSTVTAQVATLRTRPDPDDLYSLAMVQALEEALLRQGPKKRTALEQARQRTQAGEARASLHQAVRHGYRDFKHLQRNTCFHSLWSPEELAHLIRELEQEVQASAS